MNQEYIDRFIALQMMQMPRLISKQLCTEIEIRPESALLTFQLPQRLQMEDMMDELEDQINMVFLYHHIPTDATHYGTNCCAYSNPQFGDMYKINATADSNLMCDKIDVTLYDSLELMLVEIRRELEMKACAGRFAYRLADSKVTKSFM